MKIIKEGEHCRGFLSFFLEKPFVECYNEL